MQKTLQDNSPKIHFRRFEFKYQMNIAITDRIIPQMMNYMVYDPYTENKDFYEVHTLYMDSPEFKCYHEKLDGSMNRKKVRIRSYSHTSDKNADVFFELKRKSGETVIKDRMLIKNTDFQNFLKSPFDIWNIKEYKNDFMNEFLWEYSINRMHPVTLVKYKRKPFFSKFDKRFRVTFDYNISFAKPNETDYTDVYPDLVIMEVKFNGAMPRWFHDIIEMYKLNKDTFSKYCHGIDHIYGLPNYS